MYFNHLTGQVGHDDFSRSLSSGTLLKFRVGQDLPRKGSALLVMTDMCPFVLKAFVSRLIKLQHKLFSPRKVHVRTHESLVYETEFNCWGELPFYKQ